MLSCCCAASWSCRSCDSNDTLRSVTVTVPIPVTEPIPVTVTTRSGQHNSNSDSDSYNTLGSTQQ
eukprot:5715422-Pyramimonas_sp.AAC.1